MAIGATNLDPRVEEAILGVLHRRMRKFGFKGARISAGVDFDNDPVLFINADYDLVAEPIEPGATFGLITEMRKALEDVGETRFPHIRHNFDDRQEVSTGRKRKRA